MNHIIAFGASSSRASINKQFVTWATSQLPDSEVNILDLNDYEMPIFSVDRENDGGIPEEAKRFKELIREADGIVISLAEHNGSYTAAFKNILDWMSRLDKPIWCDKPMFLLSTSPGGRGGMSVMASAEKSFPFQGARVTSTFSLPFFNKNFDQDKGLLDEQLLTDFNNKKELFLQSLSNSSDDD